MFFVVDKPRLQRIIAIVREDRKPGKQGCNATFLRLKATENELTISGDKVSATFPATADNIPAFGSNIQGREVSRLPGHGGRFAFWRCPDAF